MPFNIFFIFAFIIFWLDFEIFTTKSSVWLACLHFFLASYTSNRESTDHNGDIIQKVILYPESKGFFSIRYLLQTVSKTKTRPPSSVTFQTTIILSLHTSIWNEWVLPRKSEVDKDWSWISKFCNWTGRLVSQRKQIGTTNENLFKVVCWNKSNNLLPL